MPEEPLAASNVLNPLRTHQPVAGNSEALAAVNPPMPVPVPVTTAIDRTQEREFLWKVHGYTNDHIRFADTKGAFCVGIASTLVGALFATKSHELFIGGVPLQYTGRASVLPWLSLGAFLVLGLSIVAGVLVIRPRLWTHSKKGFIFWGAISRFDGADEYAIQYKAQSNGELEDCLSHHLFTLAKICTRKYFWVNISIFLVVIGAMLSVAVLLYKP